MYFYLFSTSATFFSPAYRFDYEKKGKNRMWNKNLALMILRQITELHNIKESGSMEFEPIRNGEVKLKKGEEAKRKREN